MIVSANLRHTLAREGWWKLAHEVKKTEGLAPPETVTVQSGVKSLAMKLAADLVNEAVIERGVAAYNRVRG